MTDELSARRRAAFEAAQKALTAAGKIKSLNDWVTHAHVGWTTVNDFKTGRTALLSDRNYKKLAEAVGVSVAWLKGEEEPVVLTPLQRRFLAALDRLPEDQRQAELRALEARTQEPAEEGN